MFISSEVCSVTNEEDKYCMSIMYKDSKNPDELSNSIVTSYSSVNINVAPQYSYYDKHCRRLGCGLPS